MQSQLRDVDTVNANGPVDGFDDPEETESEAALAGPGPAADADFVLAVDLQVDALQDEVETLPGKVTKLQFNDLIQYCT